MTLCRFTTWLFNIYPLLILFMINLQMLILLYSDPNYVLEGFTAEYSISTCPLNCSNAGDCVHIQNQHVCKCHPLRGGVACEKTFGNNNNSFISADNNDSEERVLLASSWNSPLARVGHSVIRIEDKLFIYGGFDLNLILGNYLGFSKE